MKNLIIILSVLVLSFGCENNSVVEDKTSEITGEKPENSENGNTEIKPVLVIHGGAGSIKKEFLTPEMEKAYTDKMTEALLRGYEILSEGGSSSQAVITAIQIMEESPLFNAGVGAVFTHEETIELDASFMDGKTGQAGAVAGVSRIKSPIQAAYTVMNSSPHVMMAGRGAESFASFHGLEMVDPSYFYTEKSRNSLLKLKEKSKERTKGEVKTSAIDPYENDYKYGTVGAVALDGQGNLAAGTSTGGMTNKQYGRIGDSPIIGAGTFANNQTCAVSATGHGEFFIRNVVAYDIAARMKYLDEPVEVASQQVMDDLGKQEGFGGVICLDAKGNFAMPFNTLGMYRGWINKTGEPTVRMFGN